MAEAHARARHPGQSALLQLGRRRPPGSRIRAGRRRPPGGQPLGDAQDQVEIGLDGGDQGGQPGGIGQPGHPIAEEPGAAGQRIGQRFAPGELRGRQAGGDLAQGERVRAGERDELPPHPGGQRTVAGLQQLVRGGLGQAAHVHRRRHTLDRSLPAYGEQHRDPFRPRPPGGEQQRVGRGLIDPLEVVDHADQPVRNGRLGQ
ncbi:hypothetical protein AB0D67_17045 [Streptosporangium sp. NPDC048047]|uniref:hypothetical protein n=1 Tax=Streptosporangium sp. NPDC048047 TaxID=3155748 RepID=UPI0034256759